MIIQPGSRSEMIILLGYNFRKFGNNLRNTMTVKNLKIIRAMS